MDQCGYVNEDGIECTGKALPVVITAGGILPGF